MLIRRPEQTPARPVTMDGVQGVTMRIMVGRGDGAPNFSMRHFTVEAGGHTPRHAHNYEHEVYVVAGQARLEHEGRFHELAAGDVVYIEPNAVHQFSNPGSEPLRFLCLVPSEFDCGADGRRPVPGS
jgi:quercetin dioxygenase-like cupin family protein